MSDPSARAPGESPYRGPPGRPRGAATLSLRDVSPAIHGGLAAFFLALGLVIVELPRSVALTCTPNEDRSALRCVSKTRVPGLGFEERLEAVVDCTRGSVLLLGLGETPTPLDRFDVNFDYRRSGSKGPSTTYLKASCGGPAVDLTPGHTGARSDGALDALTAFQSALRGGASSTMRYRVGWGGWFYLALTGPLALLILTAGARTLVTFDRASGRVELERRSSRFGRGQRTILDVREVRRVFVARFSLGKGRPVHAPALELASGRVQRLSETGFVPGGRAGDAAQRLAELLDAPFGRPGEHVVDLDARGEPIRRGPRAKPPPP